MNLGQGIAIGLSVLLGFNYFIGTIINRKKGTSLFRWLREGAQAVLGKVTHASWVGSSSAGGRLAIGQANAPFRRVEMLYLLATREILPLLWLQRLRGRRDELVLKAVLRKRPTAEWALVLPQDRRAHNEFQAHGFQPGPEIGKWLLYHKGDLTPETRARIQSLVEHLGENLRGVTLQREEPHVVMRLSLPTDLSKPAKAFFRAIAEGLS